MVVNYDMGVIIIPECNPRNKTNDGHFKNWMLPSLMMRL